MSRSTDISRPHRAPDLIPGRKRRRTAGGYQNLGKGSTKAKDLPKGAFLCPSMVVQDARLPVPQCPLSDHAKDLHSDFLKRQAFWQAHHEFMTPIEQAGDALLGLKKRQSYKVFGELEEHSGPFSWLRCKALAGMSAGRIGRGRGTAQCSLADAFFVALAGGQYYFEELRDSYAGRHRVDLTPKSMDHIDIDREVLDYVFYSQLFWRA